MGRNYASVRALSSSSPAFALALFILIIVSQVIAVHAQTYVPGTSTRKAFEMDRMVEIVKLYVIPPECGDYMASFIKDEYVIFSSSHMDISWDRTLISSSGQICIIKARTGQLIEKAEPGTYRFDFESGKLYQLNVPFNPLIFSLDGKIGVHDPFYGLRGAYDLETGEIRAIDKDSVPGGLSPSMYPGQVSYDGSIIAVGERPTGRLVVFEWDGKRYKYLWSSPPLGDIRRIQMSVDGTLIYVGSLTSDLYAYERRGNQYVEKFRTKMNGIGALGLAEPWNPRYIWGGSADGEAFVIDAMTGETLSRKKLVTSRGYNPFYDRMGISLDALRFLPIKFVGGDGVIYDLATGEWIRYSHDELGGGSVATISETNRFIALGRTVFEVVVKQKILKLLVVGTCYKDEDLEKCREELIPIIDYRREDSPVLRAIRHLERETLGAYKIEVYPHNPLIIILPDTSDKYPDMDKRTPNHYDPPIGIWLSGKYRYDVENGLRKLGYDLGDYNAILAVQTGKILQTFSARSFRAAAALPHFLRPWGFAALSTIDHMVKVHDWTIIHLESWAVYAHELGHALFGLKDYYGAPGSKGQLYGWSLMGDHDGWNAIVKMLREDTASGLRIFQTITDGALLDVYNKLELRVLRRSYPILSNVEVDLVPTEEIVIDGLAYVIGGGNDREYYIEARTTSIDEWFRERSGIEGGVIIYSKDRRSGYVNYLLNPEYYHESYVPTLFLSDRFGVSRLVDPVGFRIFELIGDAEGSPDKFRPKVKISWCDTCRNMRGILITTSLTAEISESVKKIPLNYTIKLYGITKDGRIIGFDPITNWYWANMSGAYASGPGAQQWIFVPKDLDVKFFIRYERSDPMLPPIPLVINATWIEYGENPWPRIVIGKVEITNSTISMDKPRTLSPGQTILIKPNATTILEGDINGDGIVNHVDLALLAKHYGSRFRELRYLAVADLNADGHVNYLDLAILAKNYGKRYVD